MKMDQSSGEFTFLSASPLQRRVDMERGIVKYKSYGFLSMFRERLMTIDCDCLNLYKLKSKDTKVQLQSEINLRSLIRFQT